LFSLLTPPLETAWSKRPRAPECSLPPNPRPHGNLELPIDSNCPVTTRGTAPAGQHQDPCVQPDKLGITSRSSTKLPSHLRSWASHALHDKPHSSTVKGSSWPCAPPSFPTPACNMDTKQGEGPDGSSIVRSMASMRYLWIVLTYDRNLSLRFLLDSRTSTNRLRHCPYHNIPLVQSHRLPNPTSCETSGQPQISLRLSRRRRLCLHARSRNFPPLQLRPTPFLLSRSLLHHGHQRLDPPSVSSHRHNPFSPRL
jgi:hypothetical protein